MKDGKYISQCTESGMPVPASLPCQAKARPTRRVAVRPQVRLRRLARLRNLLPKVSRREKRALLPPNQNHRRVVVMIKPSPRQRPRSLDLVISHNIIPLDRTSQRMRSSKPRTKSGPHPIMSLLSLMALARPTRTRNWMEMTFALK